MTTSTFKALAQRDSDAFVRLAEVAADLRQRGAVSVDLSLVDHGFDTSVILQAVVRGTQAHARRELRHALEQARSRKQPVLGELDKDRDGLEDHEQRLFLVRLIDVPSAPA